MDGPNITTPRNSREIKRHLKNVNNPPYKDREPKANQSREVINISTQTSEVMKIVYQKYLVTFAKVGYTPHVTTLHIANI